jgi:hypothetical protein
MPQPAKAVLVVPVAEQGTSGELQGGFVQPWVGVLPARSTGIVTATSKRP